MVGALKIILGLCTTLVLSLGAYVVFERVESVASDRSGGTPITLNLSDRHLTSMPASVFGKRDTEILDISGNDLTGSLPGEIRHLRNLRALNASHNRMTGIPAEIGQLTELERLDYSYNDLTGLPHEIGNLQRLKVLDLRGNEPSAQDIALIQSRVPGLQILR